MIEFKPITLADKEVIESYTLRSNNPNCDMAFANMLCWQSMYHSAWAIIDGFLVVRFCVNCTTDIGYMQPVGEGDFSHIIPLLAEDAHSRSQRLRIIGLSDTGREFLHSAHPDMFAFYSDRDFEDYIYRRDELATLVGSKFKAKRNHVSHFTSAYDYRYTELTADLFDECKRLEKEWRKEHRDNSNEPNAEQHEQELTTEQRAMHIAFEHFDALELRGGVITVDQKVVAFTYGSAVNNNTFCTHVEKADTDFDGAFAVINKCFAEHLPEQFTMINREEDLGIEGLRRSKLSYNPAILLHKYTAIHLHPAEKACKRLWAEAFGDSEEFIDSFLVGQFSQEQMLSTDINGELAAMLHIVPFTSELGRTAYIYGVATDARYRNQGLSSALMHQAIERLKGEGYDVALLIPDEEWLKAFYSKFGFQSSECHVTFSTPDNFDFGTGDTTRDIAMVYQLKSSDTITASELHLVK